MTGTEAHPPDEARVRALVESVTNDRWPGARAGAPLPLAGDASSRRYLRCMLEGAGDDADAPASVVVMIMKDVSVALSSEELGAYGEDGPTELPYLNVHRYLSHRTDAVPITYAASDDFTMLVIEDVGDTTLWDAATGGAEPGREPFRAALALLASLQERCTDDGSGCYAFGQAFDARLFMWEFEHFLEYGVSTVDTDRETLNQCRAELADQTELLAGLPRVFCHRDYHAWNIHAQDDRLRLIDFQDALLGPALYDVASLLTDRTTPEFVDTDMERRLVGEFYERQRAGRLSSLEATLDAYRRCAFQRVLKVIGRFNYLADVKGKPSYRGMLPAVVATARRLLAEVGGLPATGRILADTVRAGGTTP